MPDVPIACTLTPDDMPARRALLETLAADGMPARAPIEAGLEVRLRRTPDIERRTRELIAAEARCRPSLDFELAREGGELVHRVSGPPAARPRDRPLLRAPP